MAKSLNEASYNGQLVAHLDKVIWTCLVARLCSSGGC